MTSAFLGDTDESDPDYNKQILTMIEQRMVIGKDRYGHGLRVNDDTRQWGTKDDSWTEMGLEEVLDLCVYLSAQILRIQERERRGEQVIHSTPVKPLGLIERVIRWLKR